MDWIRLSINSSHVYLSVFIDGQICRKCLFIKLPEVRSCTMIMFSIWIIVKMQKFITVGYYSNPIETEVQKMNVDTGLLWLYFRKWTAPLQTIWQAERWKSLDLSPSHFKPPCFQSDCVTDWDDIFWTNHPMCLANNRLKRKGNWS